MTTAPGIASNVAVVDVEGTKRVKIATEGAARAAFTSARPRDSFKEAVMRFANSR